MKSLVFPSLLIVAITLLSGCTSTFAGTVFVLTFSDVIYYVVLAFIIAIITSLFSENKKKAFWTWFILSLVFTPLIGFVALLIKAGSKSKSSD